jgi:GTP-binding protein HflX
LEEVREADVLLHVIDIAHPTFEDQMEVVNKTLTEIGASGKPTILVFNKIDSLIEELGTKGVEERVQTLRQSYLTKTGVQAVFISAEKKINIEELKEKILEEVEKLKIAYY